MESKIINIEQSQQLTALSPDSGSASRIIRVFPRRTNATPIDRYAYIGNPDLFVEQLEPTEIHISVTFTWDVAEAKRLFKAWGIYGIPVKIGGAAAGSPGGEFNPGMYLKSGHTITSRGCPNHCWFCMVWRREGDQIRELKINDGWNLLDNNILACSDSHINKVFDMLEKQPKAIEFTGGLEAARLKEWHVQRLARLKLKQAFFAYDTPDDYEPLIEAGRLLKKHDMVYRKRGKTNLLNHKLRCYVLIGYKRDTFEKAEKRLVNTYKAGFLPMAMLYRDEKNEVNKEWRRFQRKWARPAVIDTVIKHDVT
jgi:hypothetical protein